MDAKKTLELIKERRSVRSFTDKDVDRDALRTLVEAAIWAPTGGNIQAWEFVVLDKEDKELMTRMIPFLPGVFEVPSAMIWACMDREKEGARAGKVGLEVVGIMDIAMASQNIMLMAHAMGIGSCVIRSFNAEAAMLAMNLPEHVTPELVVILGYPNGESLSPPRIPVEQKLHWSRFGGGK